jgi:cytochrome P450
MARGRGWLAGPASPGRCSSVGVVPGQPESAPGRPGNRPGAAAGGRFPFGAAVSAADLEGDPHPALARLREHEPVSWLPVLGGWLVTRRDLALRVMRDAAAFTVDDPRFSTARVVGPSMLSLDGAEHTRHRGPFTAGFGHAEVLTRLAAYVEAETGRLVAALKPAGAADLRTGLAGPLAVAVIAEALGLREADPSTVLAWYRAIVDAVSGLARGEEAPAAGDGAAGDGAASAGAEGEGGQAFGLLSSSLRAALAAGDRSSLLAEAAASSRGLGPGEIVSNAAVLMFGGIETTEGMITNAILHLLNHPSQLRLVLDDPGLVPNAIEESLRLEPAAAVVDRYAARDVSIGDAAIRRGDLVTVSIAGAGRDPAVFPDPDRFDVRRANARLHLAFAHGPHFCLGVHLARLEAQVAVRAAVQQLPGLRLDPERPSAPRGLVFRKPTSVHVCWDLRN